MASPRYQRGSARRHKPVPVGGLWRALGLTVASAVLWGVAHLWARRRTTGLCLMALQVTLAVGGATAVFAFREKLKQVVVQGSWLIAITVAIVLLAVGWALVVIRSFQVARPDGLPTAMRVTSGALVGIMALMVCTPLVYAANAAYVLRDTLSSIFPGDDRSGGRMRSVWPDGYTGDYGPNGTCPPGACLLNELYIQGEKRHPELEPGYKKGRRGPHLLEDVIGYLTGLKMDYYVLVNLAGFKDIVNAMGGLDVNVKTAGGRWLPIGGDPAQGIRPSGYLKPGRQHLDGEHALWYARTRHADDDFHRMDRQKCVMKDIADQADPQKVVTHFEKLANAARNTISTNIPAALLPALVKLSGTVKHGAEISSLSYDPDKLPGFHTDRPADATIIQVMRRAAADAIARSTRPPATPSATPGARRTPATGTSHGAVSLKTAC